jgi:hypothetical protein
MKVDTLADFLEALRNSNVLTPPQLEQVEALAKQIADPRQLAKELVARQLLTPFQAKMIWNGRGDELVLGSYLLLGPHRRRRHGHCVQGQAPPHGADRRP